MLMKFQDKEKNKWSGKMSKVHYVSRFVDPRMDRCTSVCNIILFAQKEIIFVKEKLPQTM